MSKTLISRFTCNRCGKTAEYVENPHDVKNYNANAPYDGWHYENGLGHLCPDCYTGLRYLIKDYFKTHKE